MIAAEMSIRQNDRRRNDSVDQNDRVRNDIFVYSGDIL